ncbi:MAG: hypothetical protein IJP68_04170, partial [Selenomonadaceae bacterium]|nr:hypothetical protein [Selenomonadaceae bacterium]
MLLTFISAICAPRLMSVSARNTFTRQEASAMQSEIEAASESFLRQQRFVNDVSHELRTPLTIIRGYVDLLESYGATDPELFKEAVTSIKNSAQNMQNLVEGLLFLARADQGRQPLTKVPVDLDDLLKKFVEAYHSPRVKVSKLPPCKILAD